MKIDKRGYRGPIYALDQIKRSNRGGRRWLKRKLLVDYRLTR